MKTIIMNNIVGWNRKPRYLIAMVSSEVEFRRVFVKVSHQVFV